MIPEPIVKVMSEDGVGSKNFGDMLDHLAVIEARAKSADGKRHSTADVKKALGI